MATICMHHVLASMEGLKGDPQNRIALLNQAGINPSVTQDLSRRVHTDQVARLFKLVQLELNDEFMGFTARGCRVGVFRLMCELVSSCRTLKEMLGKATEFYGLTSSDIEIDLHSIGKKAIFTLTLNQPELDTSHFLTEFLLVIWHRFSSWYIGEPIRLQETHFVFKEPQHVDELRIMFPGSIKFGASTNQLSFEQSYLERPLVRDRQELASFVRNAPADVMTIPGRDNSLERRIARLVQKGGGDRLVFPALETLAVELELNPQALYRRLKRLGTSYQKIKDDIRRETAMRLLAEPRFSVEQVAERVGYAEARSFTRAFREWTGMSPREYCKHFGDDVTDSKRG